MKKELRRTHSFGMLLALLLCICLIASLTITAHAECYQGTSIVPEGYPPEFAQYLYPYSHTGTVICSQCNLRPDVTTDWSYGQLKNGDTCVIVGKYDDWLIIDLASCKIDQTGYAFVKKELIKEDPYWIVTTQYTNLYATPWENEKMKNGEQYNRVFLVIEEQYPFYAVQCKESSAGTSFIYQSEIGKFSKDGQNLYVCAEDNVPIYDTRYWYQIGTIDIFTIVDVYSSSNGYYSVVVNEGEWNEYTAGVNSQYLQKIIN